MSSDFSFNDEDQNDSEKSLDELINLGITYGNAGDHNKALHYFKLALDKDSTNVMALRGKGYALYNLGNYFDAIEDLDKAIIIIAAVKTRSPLYDDVYYRAWNAKGLCFLNLKQYEEALKCYLKVKELRPQYAVAYMNIAEVFYELGHFSQPEHYYDEAIRISNTKLENIKEKSPYPKMKERSRRSVEIYCMGKNRQGMAFC